MTPRQYKEYAKAEEGHRQQELLKKVEEWHHPINKGDAQLHKVLDEMSDFKLCAEDVPLIIKLVENPKYKTSKIFTGAVSLPTHDSIHVVLGRGLLPKDEAFVIGYTMGSAKKMKRWRRNLFMFICKTLYPKAYRFGEEERYIFYSGVVAGSKCPTDLTEVDFGKLADYTVQGIREKLGIDADLLKCYYCMEQKLFPDSVESQRLIFKKNNLINLREDAYAGGHY